MNSDYEQLWLDNIKVEGFSSGTAGTDILFSEDFSGIQKMIEIPDAGRYYLRIGHKRNKP